MARRSLRKKAVSWGRRVSTPGVQSAVREAISSRESVRITGGGSWMSAGRPVTAKRSISLAADKGVVDYVPEDLTITVRAGTTLEEIAAATAEHDQWLPLDPIGSAAATIGATIATASSGPLSNSFGFARDFILGLEFVTGKGDIVRSGGRVVKNVAGFDLMRLNCGGWGTLGVVTEATLRLYARPKVDRTFAAAVPPRREEAMSFFESLVTPRLATLSMELISAALASRLALPARDTVLIRLAGNPNLVDAQTKLLSEAASPTEMSEDVWKTFSRVLSAESGVAFRMSALPAHGWELWRAAQSLFRAAEGGLIHSTFARGIVRVVANRTQDLAIPTPKQGERIAYEILPADQWAAISPSVISDPLSNKVRHSFDPYTLLNPGILG
jgi:FAD/FMN-containing dehydrogenases